VRHYNLTGGYTLKLNRDLALTPSILLRYIPTLPIDVDVAATFCLKNTLALALITGITKTLFHL